MTESSQPSLPRGIVWVRRVSIPTAFVFGFLAFRNFTEAHTEPMIFFQIKGLFEIFLAFLLMVPYRHLSVAGWKTTFVVMTLASLAYGMVTVVGVIFSYIAAARIEQDLGIPAFEGTLLFVLFLQVPAIFFQRFPSEWS